MAIKVTCGSCGQTLKAKDEFAGRKTKCPGCGEPLTIPEAIYDAEEAYEDGDYEEDYEEPYDSYDDGSYQDDSDRRPCRACGEMIRRSAAKCRYCGEVFDSRVVGRTRGKSSGVDAETEKQDKSNAIVLFVTSLIGCFSPILTIYGIVFLVKRPYSFPCKGLAVAGVVLHGIWTLVLISTLSNGPR